MNDSSARRALGTYLLVFQGTLAVSSLLWGFVAERLGDPPALAAAAAGLVLAIAATWRWRLQRTEAVDMTPSTCCPIHSWRRNRIWRKAPCCRDPAQPGRYLESFVAESWAEHLRQVGRATIADRSMDERARSFLVDGDQPTVTHLVAARAPHVAEPVTIGV